MTILKNEGIEKDDYDKNKRIKKRRNNLFIFQKTEKNTVLNIHSICKCSDNLSSASYGDILSFIFDLTFLRMFS